MLQLQSCDILHLYICVLIEESPFKRKANSSTVTGNQAFNPSLIFFLKTSSSSGIFGPLLHPTRVVTQKNAPQQSKFQKAHQNDPIVLIYSNCS